MNANTNCPLRWMFVLGVLLGSMNTGWSQVNGSGSAGSIAIWTDSSTLGNSAITQDSNRNININTLTVPGSTVGKLSVSGQPSGIGILATGGVGFGPNPTAGAGVSAFGGNATTAGGNGVSAIGGEGAVGGAGLSGNGGRSSSSNASGGTGVSGVGGSGLAAGGLGIAGTGGMPTGSRGFGGSGVSGVGGRADGNNVKAGSGVLARGGSASGTGSSGGLGLEASGGSAVSEGGVGVSSRGGNGSGGGIGVFGVGGSGTTAGANGLEGHGGGFASGAPNIVTGGTGVAGYGGSGSAIVGPTHGGPGISGEGGQGRGSACENGTTGFLCDGGGAGALLIGGPGLDQGPGGVGIHARGGRGGRLGNNALAGEFDGDVTINGNIVKSGSSFQIDDPLDPGNKYLYHSSVESPDMKDMYDGVAKLDSKGEAIVNLPPWFEVLNKDFRYQLTAIGAPAPNLHIASTIQKNEFRIAGGQPGMDISWQVTGTRQDAWANAHRIPVEIEKSQTEKGSYLHPELYGAPEQKSLQWALHPEMMKHIQNMSERQATKIAAPAERSEKR